MSITHAFELDLPVACEPGKDCWVQQYVDHDASSGAADYTCGTAAYDGHDGTDIRARDTSSRIDIIASAPGTVRAIRDGEPDRLMLSEADRAAVSDKECGNGVAIAHEGGYETQYCHLREGSIAVRPGERVAAGAKLGEIGYSGAAQFPHVHLTVRKDGKAVDPFSAAAAGDCRADDMSLWSPAAKSRLVYENGSLLRLGWADGPVELAALESGAQPALVPEAGWKAIVAYAWAINLKDGDTVTLELSGPNGLSARNETVLERNKAQYFLFAGKPLKSPRWPAGGYSARFAVTRAGQRVVDKVERFSLP